MPSDPERVETSTVPGSRLTAVLVHPHPDYGGNRFNHVIDAIYRALPDAGYGAARFDLGSSDPELAREATTSVVAEVSRGPRSVVLVGYSFGADIALGTIDGAIAGWFAIAPPFQFGSDWPVARDERPKALLVAALDQFAPPERARVLTSGWANTRVESVAGADHFLNGHGAAVAGAVTAWMGGV